VDGLDYSGRHRLGHLESVRLLFSFGIRRGYVTRSPAAAVELSSHLIVVWIQPNGLLMNPSNGASQGQPRRGRERSRS
jgi:hypothetical protein